MDLRKPCFIVAKAAVELLFSQIGNSHHAAFIAHVHSVRITVRIERGNGDRRRERRVERKVKGIREREGVR